MRQAFYGAAALLAVLALPAVAEAAEGFATANVNMRSGPGTDYPAVTVIPAGAPLDINGCLADIPWCDVSFAGGRGWIAGRYVQAVYDDRRVYVDPQYYQPLGIPTVTFDLDNYWGRYYRGRPFYRDRDHWRGRPGWDRQAGPNPSFGRPGYDDRDRPDSPQPYGEGRRNGRRWQPGINDGGQDQRQQQYDPRRNFDGQSNDDRRNDPGSHDMRRRDPGQPPQADDGRPPDGVRPPSPNPPSANPPSANPPIQRNRPATDARGGPGRPCGDSKSDCQWRPGNRN